MLDTALNISEIYLALPSLGAYRIEIESAYNIEAADRE